MDIPKPCPPAKPLEFRPPSFKTAKPRSRRKQKPKQEEHLTQKPFKGLKRELKETK